MSRNPLLRSIACPLAVLLVAFLLDGCSPNQNTLTASVYHNMTAHYNGYFYADEDVRKVEKAILESLDDDHNQLLRLFPKLDTNLAKSYKTDTEEAIKMASISIQRHPNSRWVYKNFILVGLARLYDCDYLNAVQTFKYVNTKSADADTRHEALVHLIRAFNEKGEFDKAEETIDFLSKEKLSRSNAKQYYLEKAYLYQVQENYDLMVQNLTRADSLLTANDRRARIYFIIGQVYQKLGFGAEAFNYYRKCIATNPDYEIDFYARLNMAQVTQVSDKENARAIRKQFAKMLVDEKNKEFKDKIHFEIAEFELKLGNLKTAMENYQACLRTGTSKRIQGTGYLRLGQLYFDSLRKFSLAKAYYDSAVSTLPTDTEGLAAINKRKEILTEFVEYTGTIELQDSLLRMASMDTAALRKLTDSIQLAATKPLDTKKKKRRFIADDDRTEGPSGTFTPRETTTTSDWYFGNLSAVSIGQTEFQRIWGDLKLEDNWRRSVKSSAGPAEITATGATPEKSTEVTTEAVVAEKKSLFDELYAQLPLTDEARAKSLSLIEDAYFKLGDLYYFRLNEKDNAIRTYEKLMERFPDSKLRPETLYKLYLACKEVGSTDADRYKEMLLKEFPNTTFARVLLNPNYLAETTATAEKQKIIYKQAYADFNAGQLVTASRELDEAISLGETDFLPQLELLKIMVTGRTEDITLYQFELGEFIKKNAEHPLKNYAETLLAASKTFQEKVERAKGIRFTRNLTQPHQLVIVHNRNDQLSTAITDALEKVNARHHAPRKLVTSNLALDERYTLTFVLEFAELPAARDYLAQVRKQVLETPEFINFKFDIFVITQENFGTFYRTKALDEYLAFYDRNY